MFQVEWVQSALDELALQWMSSDSAIRKTVTQSVHDVDRALQIDPLGYSESRGGDDRICIFLPLVVRFTIDLGRQVVTVFEIRVVSSRKR